MARHLHVEAEVLEAARRHIPAIVLLRRPEDAVRSLKAIAPEIDENRALQRWIKYYSRIERFSQSFVVGEFQKTTDDFGAVIDAVNRRFGTHFKHFDTTDESRARVFERVKLDQETLGTQRFRGVPGRGRKAMLAKVELHFRPDLLARANKIYERFKALGAASVQPH